MKRLLVAAACVFLIGAAATHPASQPTSQPATRPAKVYRDFKSVLQEAPASLMPRAGEKWESLHRELLSDWLKTNVKGKRFVGKVTYTGSTVEKEHIRAGFEMRGFNFRGLLFQRCGITAHFPKSEATTFARLKPGDQVDVSGTLSGMVLQEGGTRDGDYVWNLNGGLSDAAVKP